MQAFLLFTCLIFLTNCGKEKREKDVAPSPRKAELQTKYDTLLAESKAKRSKDGWLDTDTCDSMLFTGKYSCAAGAAEGLSIVAAEYPSQPGRFNRRPAPFCEADAGSKTSWSRDMGMGLLAYGWCNKDLAVLERHASYGVSKQWKMGEPLDDGRVVYTPSVIGHLYQTIYSLGGKDNANRVWPSVYASGLDDYQAHLQMIDVWLRGEMAQHQNDADAMPKKEVNPALSLSVSATMFDRIKEHSDREPKCPFYQYMRGIYDTGTLEPAVELLLGDEWTCQYFRGSDRSNDLYLAEWLFAADRVLRKL
jgi:hypothetical protein